MVDVTFTLISELITPASSFHHLFPKHITHDKAKNEDYGRGACIQSVYKIPASYLEWFDQDLACNKKNTFF